MNVLFALLGSGEPPKWQIPKFMPHSYTNHVHPKNGRLQCILVTGPIARLVYQMRTPQTEVLVSVQINKTVISIIGRFFSEQMD